MYHRGNHFEQHPIPIAKPIRGFGVGLKGSINLTDQIGQLPLGYRRIKKHRELFGRFVEQINVAGGQLVFLDENPTIRFIGIQGIGADQEDFLLQDMKDFFFSYCTKNIVFLLFWYNHFVDLNNMVSKSNTFTPLAAQHGASHTADGVQGRFRGGFPW